MQFYSITEKHKTYRKRFLMGGVLFALVSALTETQKMPGNLVLAIPIGLLGGYAVWWLWAKTKQLS
jgi:hypothetical protein